MESTSLKRPKRVIPEEIFQGLLLLAKRYPRATSAINGQVDERRLMEQAVSYIRRLERNSKTTNR